MNNLQTDMNWKNYRYIGNDPTLTGHTALGRFEQGKFWIQVDHFKHPWSYGWHVTPFEDWEIYE